MNLALWTYVRCQDGTFARLTIAELAAFYSDLAPLPKAHGLEALVAEITVDIQDRRAVRLINQCYRRVYLTESGMRNSEAAREEWKVSEALVSAAHEEGKSVDNLRSPQGRFAERQYTVRYRWQPTPEDFRSLADAVNRRAKSHLMGPSGPQLVE